MYQLIIKEYICPESFEYILLLYPAKEKCLIYTDIPCPQCPYHTLMRSEPRVANR